MKEQVYNAKQAAKKDRTTVENASTKEMETAINKSVAAAAAEAAEEIARKAVVGLAENAANDLKQTQKHGVESQIIITNGRTVEITSAVRTSYQRIEAAVEARVVVAAMVEEVHIISKAITIKDTASILHLLQDHISSSPEDHLTFQRCLQAKGAKRIITDRISSNNNNNRTILIDGIDN